VAWDVTSAVQSRPPYPGQVYRFKVMYGHGNGAAVFGSRESDHPPQLVTKGWAILSPTPSSPSRATRKR